MRVGNTLYIENDQDWPRYLRQMDGEDVPPLSPNTDAEFFSEGLREVVLTEELGFDSVFCVEHHIAPYTMIPSPLQFLSYVAGVTERVDVGTMVLVIPWHNPLRVAEEMSMLQMMLEGRSAFIGFGRGAARREYKAYGIDQNLSRELFTEGIEVVKLALGEEVFSYDGEIFKYDRVSMRPRPTDAAKLIDDMHFAWGSPQSAPLGAALGLKALIIPQKELSEYHADLAQISDAHAKIGKAPSRPRLHLLMYCHEDAATAHEAARKHVYEKTLNGVRNYELLGDHFKDLRGYEHYAQLAGGDIGVEGYAQAWLTSSLFGTPDECVEKAQVLCDQLHPEEFMLTTRFGSMTHKQAVESMKLFAKEALPAIQAIPFEDPITYETEVAAKG